MPIVNPIFINNTTNFENGKTYNSVWVYKTTKMGKIKKDLVWQYYRDRNRQTVDNVLEKYKGTNCSVDIIYKNDPTIYKLIL